MAVAIDIRVQATTSAGKFRHGPLQLGQGWGTVNVARPDVRQALIDHVGVHVRVHPLDVATLKDAGLELVGDRLRAIVTTTPEPAMNAASPTQGHRRRAG